MKNRVQYKKERKIEFYVQKRAKNRILLPRRTDDSTCNLQLAQCAVFDESKNANSMGMLSPRKGILIKGWNS